MEQDAQIKTANFAATLEEKNSVDQHKDNIITDMSAQLKKLREEDLQNKSKITELMQKLQVAKQSTGL